MYDYAGRLSEAYSGIEARNFLNQVSNNPATLTVPYRRTYTHNVWGDHTGGSGGYWSNVTTTTNTVAFTNGRRSGWQYDAAGNILAIDLVNTNTYDATSRNTIIHPQNFSPQFDITQEFDGDGQVVKWHHYNSDVGTYYYLRSSVLGGKIVTEIHGETNSYWSLGSKSKLYVYAGGEVIAEQRISYNYPYISVVWMHADPAGSDVSSQIGGAVSLEHEFDPMGGDVGYSDPAYTSPPYVPDPPVPTYTGGGNMGNPACTLDGVEYDCAALFNLLSHGSAAIAPPQAYVPVTANYSNGTSRRIGFAKWNSQNNSYEATLKYQDYHTEQDRYLSLTWDRGGQVNQLDREEYSLKPLELKFPWEGKTREDLSFLGKSVISCPKDDPLALNTNITYLVDSARETKKIKEVFEKYGERDRKKYNTVVAHGNPFFIAGPNGDPVYPAQLAVLIKKDPNYDPSKPVKLFSCNSGTVPIAGGDTFAQQLANILGNSVIGANGYVCSSYWVGIYTSSSVSCRTTSGLFFEGTGIGAKFIQFNPK